MVARKPFYVKTYQAAVIVSPNNKIVISLVPERATGVVTRLMRAVVVTWDYKLILEWCDDSGVFADGPNPEKILPRPLLKRMCAWAAGMEVVYGDMGHGLSLSVPSPVAQDLHQKLLDIRAEIRSLGYGVAPIDEWWIEAAAE